ncbi:disulfide bond formation protein B [Govanella unica]|uniref:Disulfide bond formation protein B n=1 Tax=Govanella unica TaxID=2975056 RepID=A0A9X3Z624_9PROT|nr:disulfide bond formation protein B [Govania unica]MDA5192632.1 disulfide bond formation protein B [Govania unica]
MPRLDRNIPLILTAASIAILGTVFALEHVGGYLPCELCWWQRYVYMAAIPLGVLAIVTDRPEAGGSSKRLLALLGFLFLMGAGIAGYHFGVEQKWWQGPTACSSIDLEGSIEDVFRAVMAMPIIRCDSPSWTLFGLSMAGYNFILSLILAALALRGAQSRL